MDGLIYFQNKHCWLCHYVNFHVHCHDGEQKEAESIFQFAHSKTPKSLFPSAQAIHLQWYWLLLPSHRMKSSTPRAAVSEWVLAEVCGRKTTFLKFNIYGAASPTPPCGWVMVPPPLWLWGCGGALLVSDAADFLWFLVPPPPVAGKNWVYFAFCLKLLFQARCWNKKRERYGCSELDEGFLKQSNLNFNPNLMTIHLLIFFVAATTPPPPTLSQPQVLFHLNHPQTPLIPHRFSMALFLECTTILFLHDSSLSPDPFFHPGGLPGHSIHRGPLWSPPW